MTSRETWWVLVALAALAMVCSAVVGALYIDRKYPKPCLDEIRDSYYGAVCSPGAHGRPEGNLFFCSCDK